MTYPGTQEDRNFDGLVEHQPPAYASKMPTSIVRFSIKYPDAAQPQHIDVRSDSNIDERLVPIAAHHLRVEFDDDQAPALIFPPGMLGGSGRKEITMRLEEDVLRPFEAMGLDVTVVWNRIDP